jgi:hypothetical protein
MRRPPRLLIAIFGLIFITATTILVIKMAKGYRPSLQTKALKGTGLLAANSVPKGSSVFINTKLTTATDDTLNLPPGDYEVTISKDGYISWSKKLKLEEELVTQTDARLFPSVPDLKPLTFSGAINPLASPDSQKLVFGVQNATNEAKNGLYVLDLVDRQFSFGNEAARQITRSQPKYDFTQAELTWTPDSTQILATLNAGKDNEINVLLSPTGFNDTADFLDVTARLPLIYDEWNDYLDKQSHERLKELPELMQTVATASAEMFAFSPDNEMMLYLAKEKVTIPEQLIESLPSTSTQKESREIEPGNVYIYDLKEDKNFWIAGAPLPEPSAQPAGKKTAATKETLLTAKQMAINRFNHPTLKTIMWFPDSRHMVVVEDGKIMISDYDGTNRQTIYAGPFSEKFAYPWPNANRLMILASLNGGSNLPPNLYSINLK